LKNILGLKADDNEKPTCYTYYSKFTVSGRKEGKDMEWQFIVALIVAIPVILFPAAFVWYLNAGGILKAIREAKQRRMAKEQKTTVTENIKN